MRRHRPDPKRPVGPTGEADLLIRWPERLEFGPDPFTATIHVGSYVPNGINALRHLAVTLNEAGYIVEMVLKREERIL